MITPPEFGRTSLMKTMPAHDARIRNTRSILSPRVVALMVCRKLNFPLQARSGMDCTVFVHDQTLKAHVFEKRNAFLGTEYKDPGGEGIGVYAISCNDACALASLGRISCLWIKNMVETVSLKNKISLVIA